MTIAAPVIHARSTFGAPGLPLFAPFARLLDRAGGVSAQAIVGLRRRHLTRRLGARLRSGVAAGVTARLVHAISARHGGAIAITHAAFATGCTFLRIGRHDPAQHRRTHQSCQHDPLEHGSSTFLIRGTAPLMISL